jgi:hypothetical protein
MVQAPENQTPQKTREEQRPIQYASEGIGSLFQRDYAIVIRESACTPEHVIEKIRAEFPRFSPSLFADFYGPDVDGVPLTVDDTMHVNIRGAGHCGVQVVHVEACSFTLRTLRGHIEAGRITFTASLNEEGHLVCRIRSRARIYDLPRYLGYEVFGKHVQTEIWETFLERVAEVCGGSPIGGVMTSSARVAEEPGDRPGDHEPTVVPNG